MKANAPKMPNERLVPVEIAGQNCYFLFSLRAAKIMMQKNVSIDDLPKTEAGKPNGNEADFIDLIVELYALLIEEGARYADKAYGEKVASFSAEELGTLLSLDDALGLQDSFALAIKKGGMREVEAVPPKKAKTAQVAKA